MIADNMAQGRLRALWISKNDNLLEDARRDWTAIGGAACEITAQSAWKQADAVRMDRSVLFTTYATLRQPGRGDKPSRLDQIIAWLGDDFDGVIVFDEGHAMANAAGGAKGARAEEGLAARHGRARAAEPAPAGAGDVRERHRRPTPENLAYAARLHLWGGPEAPFPTRDAFMEAVDKGAFAGRLPASSAHGLDAGTWRAAPGDLGRTRSVRRFGRDWQARRLRGWRLCSASEPVTSWRPAGTPLSITIPARGRPGPKTDLGGRGTAVLRTLRPSALTLVQAGFHTSAGFRPGPDGPGLWGT